MPLGMELGLDPGDIVLDGNPAPLPKKGVEPPFSAHFYCGQPPPQKGQSPPNFWPTSILAKQLRGSRCHLVLR